MTLAKPMIGFGELVLSEKKDLLCIPARFLVWISSWLTNRQIHVNANVEQLKKLEKVYHKDQYCPSCHIYQWSPDAIWRHKKSECLCRWPGDCIKRYDWNRYDKKVLKRSWQSSEMERRIPPHTQYKQMWGLSLQPMHSWSVIAAAYYNQRFISFLQRDSYFFWRSIRPTTHFQWAR